MTKFYCCSKFGVMLCLAAAIEYKLKDFSVLHCISIVQGIIEGLCISMLTDFVMGM